MSVSDDEFDLFRSAMGDVKPLKSEPRVKLAREPVDGEVLQARREAAQARSQAVADGLPGSYVEPVDARAELSFMRPGIQHCLFKKFKQGLLPMEAALDLHGMNVDQARLALAEFIRDCREHEIRFALVTHGKGEGRAQPAVLKSCISTWLPQMPAVLAFHTAQPRHGGYGATYLMLRRGEG